MPDVQLLVSGIDHKIRSLVDTQKNLQLNLRCLEVEREDLKKIIENQKSKIKELERNIDILKITGSLSKDSNTRNVKLTINELIRELDRCVGLLESGTPLQ